MRGGRRRLGTTFAVFERQAMMVQNNSIGDPDKDIDIETVSTSCPPRGCAAGTPCSARWRSLLRERAPQLTAVAPHEHGANGLRLKIILPRRAFCPSSFDVRIRSHLAPGAFAVPCQTPCPLR
jgi:hypothetical protein